MLVHAKTDIRYVPEDNPNEDSKILRAFWRVVATQALLVLTLSRVPSCDKNRYTIVGFMSSTSNFKMAEWNDEITDKDVTDSVGFQSRFQFELFYRDIRVFFGPRFLS